MPENSTTCASALSGRLEHQGRAGKRPIQTRGRRSGKGSSNSQHWDVISISDSESDSEEPVSKKARNARPRSPYSCKNLGVVEITTDEESDSLELPPAVNKKTDQVVKVSEGMTLFTSLSCTVLIEVSFLPLLTGHFRKCTGPANSRNHRWIGGPAKRNSRIESIFGRT